MTTFAPRWLFLAAFCAITALAPHAWAQAEDEAAARALFIEGRKLLDAGQYPAACTKFESARKLYASVGVLLNLGDCYEKTGRTASAWTMFGEAQSLAGRQKRSNDEAEAKRRLSELDPRLSHLALHVAREVPGLTIRRDGVELPQAVWGEAIPVDPGNHELRAEAAGYEAWTSSVTVSPQDQNRTVEVPELRHLPTAEATPVRPEPMAGPVPISEHAPREPGGPPGAGQRVAGFIVGGAGILAVGTGVVMGLVAKAQDSAAQSEPGTARSTDSNSAVGLGNAATVVAIVGAVATAAGVVVWLTAPSAPAQVGTNSRELFLRGTF